MEQQKEGIRQEFMLLNWYLKEHLASAVRIAAFIGVFSLLCFLRNVPPDHGETFAYHPHRVGDGSGNEGVSWAGYRIPVVHRELRRESYRNVRLPVFL